VSDALSVPIPRTVDAGSFKAAFRQHAAGVAVVTAEVDGRPLALTASSVTSVSADPAVLLLSASMTTSTGRALARAGSAVVHLLDRTDLALAVMCADPEADRFADPATWERLPTGEPAFRSPRLLLRGEVVQRTALGEATVLLIAVTDVLDRRPDAPPEDPGPLAYHDRRWHVLGPHSEIA
jgi:flavin reductase (DIM6/NTAB) family NADH-FMN oxidoreductase RutF